MGNRETVGELERRVEVELESARFHMALAARYAGELGASAIGRLSEVQEEQR